ncbi:MAG: tetratricopeptide repeat protein [Deltaproteobacteria bacterium]
MDPVHKRYILENRGQKSVSELARDLGLKERKVRKFLEREGGVPCAAPEPGEARVPSRKKTAAALLALLCLGFLAYGTSLRNPFVWDDPNLVTRNVYIKSASHLGSIFTSDVEAGSGGATRFFRPLLTLSFMADYALCKLDPAGYHLTNILLHVLACWAFYGFLRVLLSDGLTAFLAAALFAVHPVHTEAVTYVSGRSDPLALTFLLCAFVFYLRSLRRATPLLLMGLGISYACALLSRESALILPVLILAYHGIFHEKMRGRTFAFVIFPAVAYLLVRGWVFRHAPPPPATLPFGVRWPGAFAAVLHYLRLLVWPLGLHMEYGMPVFPPGDPRVLAGALLLALAVFFAWRQRRRDPAVAFGIAWFLIGLVPVLNLFPLNAYMAEHWLYAPSVGLFLLLGLSLKRLTRRAAGKAAAFSLTACLLLSWGVLAARQNIVYWRDPKRFYEITLQYAPHSSRVLSNLGHLYQAEGRLEEAAGLYERAIAINPQNELRAYSGLGAAYLRMGRPADAIAVYEKAIAINPGFYELYSNLGSIYDRVGRPQEALEAFRTAVRLNQNSAAAQMNLGVLLARGRGTVEEAFSCYRKAVALDPEFPEAYFNMGDLYLKLGHGPEAASYFRQALALRPDYDAARRELAEAERIAAEGE